MTPKTFKIKSFGCQMNVYDGERMAELLARTGMAAAADGEDADLVVLNTCHIREKAAEKAYSDVGRLRREDGSKPLIALAGCVAQAEGAEAQRRSPMIDIVVGPQAYHRLPEMVARGGARRAPGRHRHAGDQQVRRASRAAAGEPERLPDRPGRLRQILHLLRRALHARRRDLAAVAATSSPKRMQLVDGGAREIVLLGQNVNAWADGSRGFADLIRDVGRDRWPRAHPLHHQPSGRHERRADRRARRGRQADALSAPAGAVGQQPHPQGDEPQPHGRDLSRDARQDARGPARHRAFGRLHRRLPGRDRGRFRGDAADRRCSRATPRPIRSNTAPRPGTPAATMEDQIAARNHGRAAAAAAGADHRAPAGVQPLEGRHATRKS